MTERNIKIEKNNYNMCFSKVSISIYGATELDNAKDLKKDIDDFYDYINQKYNQSSKQPLKTFLDYLKSLI